MCRANAGPHEADPKMASDPGWASDTPEVGAISPVVKGGGRVFRRREPAYRRRRINDGAYTMAHNEDGGSREPPPWFRADAEWGYEPS
jgi:hypothetical protein